jgi:dipeptidase E
LTSQSSLINSKLNLLCMSNGTMHGGTFLAHGHAWLADLFAAARQVMFIPFAGSDHCAYTEEARIALDPLGLAVIPAYGAGYLDAAKSCDGFVIGGGNSFRLLKALQDTGLFDLIRDRVQGGTPYAGASAGAIVTGPTIMTTNDMPIVVPRTLEAFGFLPFQLNAHYFDPDPNSTFMGETRAARLAEYHEEQDLAVLGLREGAALRVKAGQIDLIGHNGAKAFIKGQVPFEVGQDIGAMIEAP